MFYSKVQRGGMISLVKLAVTEREISVYVGHDRGHYYIAVRNH